MLNPISHNKRFDLPKYWRRVASLAFLFLLIEFLDELNYTLFGAALPVIRTDLTLTYAQVGLLFGLPHITSSLVEMVIMLLGDTRLRKALVVGGGIVVMISLILIATATSFPFLMVAMILGFPASGAFVTLSQATLMDLNPGREPHMMARWTLFGSLGNLVGPLILAGGFALAWGWRWPFFLLAGLALALTWWVWRSPFPARHFASETPSGQLPTGTRETIREILRNLGAALVNLHLLRWIVLLMLSDLLMDVFTSYLPLYLTDVVGISPAQTSLFLSLAILASLASDIVLIPLLERFPGRKVVRLSAAAVALAYPVWLLVPWLPVKLLLVLVIKFITLGWYSVLQGEAYASVPGRSGTVMAVNSLAGLLGGVIPFLIGWTAQQAGLPAAMWLLLLGPLSLAIFVPRPRKIPNPVPSTEKPQTP